MGLFIPLNESTALNELSTKLLAHARDKALSQAQEDFKNSGDKSKHSVERQSYASSGNKKLAQASRFEQGRQKKINKSWNKFQRHIGESAAALLGLTDEELYDLNEGNCNSDTCKCKGGTCPVSVTDGISTSSYAAKKLANAGSNNKTDMNAVVPNAEYSRQNDALFIGDGDSPETSKTNIPAILAAKTAGGAPHGWTTDNGINGTGSNVFKLRKLRDDDDGPNG